MEEDSRPQPACLQTPPAAPRERFQAEPEPEPGRVLLKNTLLPVVRILCPPPPAQHDQFQSLPGRAPRDREGGALGAMAPEMRLLAACPSANEPAPSPLRLRRQAGLLRPEGASVAHRQPIAGLASWRASRGNARGRCRWCAGSQTS